MTWWYVFLWFWMGPLISISIGGVLILPWLVWKSLEDTDPR